MANANTPQYKTMKLEERAMPLAQVRAIRRGSWRTCVNCDQFNKETEGCKFANGSRPPAMVIVMGCDSWVEEIPF